MKRIGVMGCGVVAGYGHVPAILATDGLALTALYDPNTANLQAMQERYHVPQAFTEVEAFFQSGLDGVVITSPAFCHYQNVLDAVRYGVPILCEKPLAMTEAEAEAMIAAAERARVPLYTAFDYRYSPVAQRIYTLVRQGTIGEVRSLRLVYIWNLHGKYVTQSDGTRLISPRRDGRMKEGGPMVDCGVHQIDLARWWLGSDVVRARGIGAWVDDEWEAPDHMYLHLDHANRAHTMVEISYSYAHTATEPISTFTYELIGTEGVIRYDRNAKTFEARTAHGTEQFPFAGEKNFQGMYDAFAQSLVTGASDTLPTGADGLIATRLARTATDEVIRERLATASRQ